MFLSDLNYRLRRAVAGRRLRQRVTEIEHQLESQRSPAAQPEAPVLFFNASTRINTLSLNAAFSLVSAWGMRARGCQVGYIVCQQGMHQCVLGTSWRRPQQPPPCDTCVAFSQHLFPDALTHPLTLAPAASSDLEPALAGLSVDQLARVQHHGLPLGELCLPSLRWALRLHDVPDDESSRFLFRQYLRSAASVAAQLERILARQQPQALVVFNGITYPEAVARAVARERGIPVVTHEVGLRPLSAFFSHREATFRQIEIEPAADLSEEESERLDRYLRSRRQGDFSMAAVRFWESVGELPQDLMERVHSFERVCTVFTNVVFDTSQVHANVIFHDMFDWLDWLHAAVRAHPEVLFVIRAHPDEGRPGKAARQSVAHWIARSRVGELENVQFVPASSPVSSYELVQVSDLCLIYNSSIGLEAAIDGKPVLAAGRARFSDAAVAVLPQSRAAYEQRLNEWFEGRALAPPAGFEQRARAFLNRELYSASLDFSGFVEPEEDMPGMVRLKAFDHKALLESAALETIAKGILDEAPFELSSGTAAEALA